MIFKNVRIWWWKWRYVERLLKRAMPAREQWQIELAWESADAAWEMNLQSCDGDVREALADDPKMAADEELLEWAASQ
jgi:hypothetical protein